MQIHRYSLPLVLNSPTYFSATESFSPVNIAIWKYTISIWGMSEIGSLPKIINAYIAGTGFDIPPRVVKDFTYCGTCFDYTKELVYHVYLELETVNENS